MSKPKFYFFPNEQKTQVNMCQEGHLVDVSNLEEYMTDAAMNGEETLIGLEIHGCCPIEAKTIRSVKIEVTPQVLPADTES